MIATLRLHRSAARATVAALLALTLYGCDSAGAGAAGDSREPADFGLLQQVARQVQKSYVEPVSGDQLTEDALKGMLTRLDPHSDYMDQEQYQQMSAVTRGEFGGIGIELTLEGKVPEVIAPIDGTPAANAGIEPGDRIVKINGQPTTGMDVEAIVKRLRGSAGSKVTLEIARTDRPPFNLTLTRNVIHVVSVKSALQNDRIGYVRVTTFTENTAAELANAIAQLKQQAHRLNGLVLDLRNDPGGLLDASVDVTGEFIDGGVVVTTRGRNSDDDRIYRAPIAGNLIPGVPIVVLINSATASAAEIVAGALQDDHRATIMGTRSFGKGSVQTIIPLEGEHGALRLTTALYYTPSGRSIQGQGITPDVVVSLPKNEQVANAVLSHESDLYRALKNAGSLNASTAATPVLASRNGAESEEHPIKPLIIGTSKDAQLEAAVDYLQRAVRRDAGAHPG